MSAERKKMIEALKEHVVPILKARGFKGSFPHFRRPTDTLIHLLTFQFDKWGSGFVVQIASCPVEGVTMHWGEHVPPAKVTAYHVWPRLRLGSTDSKCDHWFRYDRGGLRSFDNVYEITAREVLPFLDSQAEAFWIQPQPQNPMTDEKSIAETKRKPHWGKFIISLVGFGVLMGAHYEMPTRWQRSLVAGLAFGVLGWGYTTIKARPLNGR